MAAVGRHAHERLRHEARERVHLATDLLADLAVRREVVRGDLGAIEVEVQLELARGVLVVALDHVEAQTRGVLHDLVDQRLELGELVDVVAEGLREALNRRRAVRVVLQPHHLGLSAGLQMHAGLGLEGRLRALEQAATVGGEVGAGVDVFLATAEQRAEDATDLGIPRQLRERLGVGQTHQLARLGAVADVLAMAVDEQVRRSAVDELKALAGHTLPVLRRHTLAHDAAGHRRELVVDVLDALGINLATNLLDLVVSTRCCEVVLHIRHRGTTLLSPFPPSVLGGPSVLGLIENVGGRGRHGNVPGTHSAGSRQEDSDISTHHIPANRSG